MYILQSFDKHIQQIKRGGFFVILKKFRSLIFLIFQLPIYLISIPAVILIHLISPWFLIRWYKLRSSRIGHFAKETELYCCKRDAGINIPSQKFVDVFCLRKYVCNKQLEKMWRRKLAVLPTWLLAPLYRINRFINIFASGENNHEIEDNTMRDVHNLLERCEPHLNFTEDEEIKGKKILTEFGVLKDAKFVCLLVRDSGYLDKHKAYEHIEKYKYHNYRDGDIDRYVLAAEELARRGYYVFRMGINVLKPLKSFNPKIIDYANSDMRSDFMDIYLGAKCNFCISTGSGFDDIPGIFRKPIAYTSFVSFGYINANREKDLIITKHHKHKKNKNKLSISEIFSSKAALYLKSEEYELNNIELEENSPEEIKDLVIEMDERLNERWKDTKEDLLLQKRFWSIFEDRIKRLNLKKPLHGKINARFGAKFLRENQNWIR
jgi:putative glycosyltransferase (TIGR04372 family)